MSRAQHLWDRYVDMRSFTETLAGPLSAEDQIVQSMDNASPTKWHRAHTSWFFETFLVAPSLPGYRLFDDSFSFLYNSYYEAVGEQHARHQRGMITRPSLATIADYRNHVDAAMKELLDHEESTELLDLVELGIHHEQQHQELLLMDIKHAFSVNPTKPAYVETALDATEAFPAQWVSFDGGVVPIGHVNDGFCFDNELPPHNAYLQPYEIASSPVTNGDWIEFMADGGYTNVALWLSEGWANCQTNQWGHPAYWHQATDGSWSIFTLAGMQQIDPNEPVSHISYVEADAFARWAGARLPTEFEWEHAAGDAQVEGNFASSGRYHPGGAAQPETGKKPALNRLFGDVWEWTSSAYAAYPGFEPAQGAVGEYNGKFMMNQQVLRGGCALSPANHVRKHYRNFFPTSTRWHCSGVRLARHL